MEEELVLETKGGIKIISCGMRNFGSMEYPIYRFKVLFPEKTPSQSIDIIRDSLERKIRSYENNLYYRDYCTPPHLIHLSGMNIKQAREYGECIENNIASGSLFPGFSSKKVMDEVIQVLVSCLSNVYT